MKLNKTVTMSFVGLNGRVANLTYDDNIEYFWQLIATSDPTLENKKVYLTKLLGLRHPELLLRYRMAIVEDAFLTRDKKCDKNPPEMIWVD